MSNEFRVVIDTNVAVSAILFPNSTPRQAFDAALARGRLLISESTIRELEEVLKRPKFNKYIPEPKRLELLAAIVRESNAVEVLTHVTDCRDPKDNKFLELAIDGGASHIITGDEDLILLNPYHGVAILTPMNFLNQTASQ